MSKSSKRKNNYVKRGSYQSELYAARVQRKKADQKTEDFYHGVQYGLDILSLSLKKEFGFGPVRLLRLFNAFYDMFHEAQKNSRADKDKEAWYSDEKFEEAMKQAWGENYVPSEERYEKCW